MPKAKQITVLELRCATSDGLTVQDLLPPSIHPDTGQPYKWGGKGDWRDMPVIPAALLAVWQQEVFLRRVKRRRLKGKLSLSKRIVDTPRQRARVAAALGYISADCAYERYRDIVWAILSLGWNDAEDVAEQWCQSAPHRFEQASFDAVITSYDEKRSPTIGTIIYCARAGGWDG